MKNSLRKRMCARGRKFHARHVAPVIQATAREINELCEVFQWTEHLSARRGLRRE